MEIDGVVYKEGLRFDDVEPILTEIFYLYRLGKIDYTQAMVASDRVLKVFGIEAPNGTVSAEWTV